MGPHPCSLKWVFASLSMKKFWILGYPNITKTYLYNFDPLKPHFLDSKPGVYRGIHYFSYFCSKNIDCGYLLEPSCRGISNKYPESMFWAEIWKISEFLSESFQFLVVKFSIYLNRRVFVMIRPLKSLIRLCESEGWSQSSQGAHVQRYIFWFLCLLHSTWEKWFIMYTGNESSNSLIMKTCLFKYTENFTTEK